MSDPTKLGFLSLEFVVGEDTYWLTTGLGRGGFYFTQLPRSLFGDTLHAQLITRDRDYSEITVVEREGKRANLFRASQADVAAPLDVDLFAASRLSWSELATRLIDAIPLADQCGLWHNQIVRKVDPAFAISDVNYKVTAFLAPPPAGEGILAVYGEDYKLPENPNWITCHLPDEASFKARLRQFRIEAVHINGRYWPVSDSP